MVDCGQYGGMQDPWLAGEFINGFVCTFAPDPTSQVFFALILYAGIGIALFIHSESVVLPAVLGILTAGAVFVFLPPSIVNYALVVALLVLSVGGLLLVRALDRRI